jgi:muramoyltetrapeptide carboxypeptidase
MQNSINRRKFIGMGLAIAGGTQIFRNHLFSQDLHSNQIPGESIVHPTEQTISSVNNVIFPKKLKTNDIIAIVSPSSPTNRWEVTKTVNFLKSLNLKVEIGKSITKQTNNYRYLAASDEDRIEEFNYYINREDISAIIASRGGYGSMRIIEDINFDSISKNPKIFIGFSDFTFILNAISKINNLATYYGPVGISSFTDYTKKYFINALFENQKEIYTVSKPEAIVINEGKSEGRLIGGNLTMCCATLGTPYEIMTDNCILMLEDINVEAYEIDRMLNQLKLAGKFNNLQGIVLGYFSNIKRRKHFYPNFSYTILEVFEQVLKPYNIPIIANFPFGHISEQATFPILGYSTLNTTNKSLTINNSK